SGRSSPCRLTMMPRMTRSDSRAYKMKIGHTWVTRGARKTGNSKPLLHEQVGLQIRTEVKGVFADKYKSVLFVKSLSTRIVFPYTKPHYVAAGFESLRKARVHQGLANALAKIFLVRVKTIKLDRRFRDDLGLGGFTNELCIDSLFTVELSDQK